MEQSQLLPMNRPATYRICVAGSMDRVYAKRYWGMKLSLVEKIGEPVQTALVGEVADQAALVGIINALYNSGHTVVSVERLLPDADPHMDDRKEET